MINSMRLKLQGNTMGQDGVVQNDGKNLTLDNGTRIDVKLMKA